MDKARGVKMIIDLILDRKYDIEHGADTYSARRLYIDCLEYSSIFSGIGDEITLAMDYGTESAVKKAICNYIIRGDYNPDICNFVNSVMWLQ